MGVTLKPTEARLHIRALTEVSWFLRGDSKRAAAIGEENDRAGLPQRGELGDRLAYDKRRRAQAYEGELHRFIEQFDLDARGDPGEGQVFNEADLLLVKGGLVCLRGELQNAIKLDHCRLEELDLYGDEHEEQAVIEARIEQREMDLKRVKELIAVL